MKKTLITIAVLAMGAVAQAAVEEPWDALKANVTSIALRPGQTTFYGVTAPAASSSYTWTAVLDWDSAITNLNNWSKKSHIYATDGAHTWAAMGVALYKGESGDNGDNSGTLQLMLSQYGTEKWVNTATSISGLTSASEGSGLVFDEDTYSVKGKLALSFSYDSSKKTYTLGVLKNNGFEEDGITPKYSIGTLTLNQTDVDPDGDGDYTTWTPDNFTGVNMTEKAISEVEHFMWFNDVLSTAQMQEVMAAVVPEPTTATLSLLALAGLAARRRRK